MNDIKPECPTYAEPTKDEISCLDSLPHAAHEVQSRMYCELAEGQSGRRRSALRCVQFRVGLGDSRVDPAQGTGQTATA
jgi:hypothetical protein